MHPLLTAFHHAARDHWPTPDNTVDVVGPAGKVEAVVAFTGHAIVATAMTEAEVRDHGPDGIGGAHHPAFLQWLARGGTIDVLDLVLVAEGTGKVSGLERREDLAGHPRVVHATEIRDQVTVWGDDRGLVTLADGLAGRRELSVEAAVPGGGHGADLIRAGLAEAQDGEPVFVAVAPGNVRSLRAFLTLGFRPVASEVILVPGDAHEHE